MKNRIILILASLLISGQGTHATADFLVSDNFGGQILRYSSTDGSFLGSFISDDPDVNGGLSGPVGMVLNSNGDLLVASQGSNQVLRYHGRTGEFLGVFAEGEMAGPSHLGFHPTTGNLLVSNFAGSAITEFDAAGNLIGDFTTGSTLNGSVSFTFGPDGNLYAGDFNTGIVKIFDENGAYQDDFATGVTTPAGLIFLGDQLWVASLFANQVTRFNSDGSIDFSFSTNDPDIPQNDGTFPSFILESPLGNDEILVALTGSGGVYRFGMDGESRGVFMAGGGLVVPGQVLQIAPIPEPGAWLPLTFALTGLSLRRKR